MFSFLQNFFHGITGRPARITQHGEVGAPPITKDTSKNKFSFLNMIWYGFFGRFVTPRVPEQIEEGKRPTNYSTTPDETTNMKSGHQANPPKSIKVKNNPPGFFKRKWHQWFGKGHNDEATKSGREIASVPNELSETMVEERKTGKQLRESLNERSFYEEVTNYPVTIKITSMEDLTKETCQNDECIDTESEFNSSDEDNDSIEDFRVTNVQQKVDFFENLEIQHNDDSGIYNKNPSYSQSESNKLLPKVYKEKPEKEEEEEEQSHSESENKLVSNNEAQDPGEEGLQHEKQKSGSSSTIVEKDRTQHDEHMQQEVPNSGTSSISNGKKDNGGTPMQSFSNISPIQDERNFTKEVVLGLLHHGPLGIPIASVDFVNNYKQMTLSVSNHNHEIRFTRQGYFTKGCSPKGTFPSVLSHGHAQFVFEKELMNIKLALGGVLALNIYPADKNMQYVGQAMLVIWWILPAISKNRFAAGIVNECVNVDKFLYKKMKHQREYWFIKGKADQELTKNFPKVLGKYNITVAAHINSANRATCQVEIS